MQTSSRPVYLPGPGMHHLPNARSPHVVNPVPQPSIGDSKQPLPSAWCLQALQVPHHTDGAHARDQSATTPAVSIKNGHPVVVIQRNAQYRRICRGARSVAIAGTVGKGRQVIASTLPCCADRTLDPRWPHPQQPGQGISRLPSTRPLPSRGRRVLDHLPPMPKALRRYHRCRPCHPCRRCRRCRHWGEGRRRRWRRRHQPGRPR